MNKTLTIQTSPTSRVLEIPLDVDTGKITLMPGTYSREEVQLILDQMTEATETTTTETTAE